MPRLPTLAAHLRHAMPMFALAGAVTAVTAVAALPEPQPAVSLVATPTPQRSPSRPSGARLAVSPEVSPLPLGREPTLADVRDHLEAGRDEAALVTAEAVAAQERWGRKRDAALLTVGLLHRQAGRHNAASEAFTGVRAAEGPLAPWAAYYEAEQDLARGKPYVAAQECKAYAEAWPDGPYASACRRLVPRALAAVGASSAAREAAAAYDADHKDGIGEQIELAIAEQLMSSDPTAAVAAFRELSVNHRAPLTGRVAEERLAELAAAGVPGAALPDDTASLQARAISLRRAARRDDAWAAYEALAGQAADDAALTEWIAREAKPFGWYTWRWEFLADWYRARYEDEADPGDLNGLYKVLCRDGLWQQAAAVGKDGLSRHGGSSEWRRSREDVARILLLAKDYAGATELLDRQAASGGWSGRRAAFYAGFATFMAGDYPGAIERLTSVVGRSKTYELEARYWRSKAHRALGDVDSALSDEQWVTGEHPSSWYASLLRLQDPAQPTMAPFARSGRWPGAELPEAISSGGPSRLGLTPVGDLAARRVMDAARGFASMSWPMRAGPPAVTEALLATTRRDLTQPPPSVGASALYDPEAAERHMMAFAEEHAEAWPELRAAADLARAGLYDLSGPLMASVYEDRKRALRSASHPRHRAATRVDLKQKDWRELFLFTRDAHHSSRFVHSLWDQLDDPELAREAMRLGHPLAHAQEVWRAARLHDVDPYLVLGLMRQESTYDPNAVSSAGARGAMQIMPRTGNLLADLAHDEHFQAGELEDPVLAVDYGITYLGLLLDRFDGVFPLAVASYNGGPHNVSVWLEGTGTDMPIDAFVEHIPFRETRRYVKKVSTNYGLYVDLYAPEGTVIAVPPHPLGDDPGVVDF